jgi:hypothetical protein
MNRFSFNPDEPAGPDLEVEEDGPIGTFLAAIYCAELEMEEPATPDKIQLRKDHEATAESLGCSLYTAMVLCLLAPIDGPEYVITYAEGCIEGLVTLAPLRRDIVRGYACVTTTGGECLERGPLRFDEEIGWHYRVQHPEDPRLGDAIAFTIVLGAPHVNA